MTEDGSDVVNSAVIIGVGPDDPRLVVPTKITPSEWMERKRNTYACIRCHSSKQKCTPSDLNDVLLKPCVRCSKQNEVCSFDLSKRTRKRKPKKLGFEKKARKLQSKQDQTDSTNAPPLSDNDASQNGVQNETSGADKIYSFTNLNGTARMNGTLSFSSIQPMPSILTHQLPLSHVPSTQAATVPASNSQHMMHTTLSEYNQRTAKRSNGNPYLYPQVYSSMQAPSQLYDYSASSTDRNNLPGIQQSLSDLWPSIRSFSMENTYTVNPPTTNGNVHSSKRLSPATAHPSPVITASGSNSNDISCSSPGQAANYQESFAQHIMKELPTLVAHQKSKLEMLSRKLSLLSENTLKVEAACQFTDKVLDPITLGMISEKEAKLRLQTFRQDVSLDCRVPFFRNPCEMNLDVLRKERPIYLSAILAMVSVIMSKEDTTAETCTKLGSYTVHLLKMQLFNNNFKSIEILESLQILCMWYNIPDWMDKTRYHLFDYLSGCLTKDLGPMVFKKSSGVFSEENPIIYRRQNITPLELYEDGPRLTLSTYVLALNNSLFLRQTSAFRWSALTENAKRVFEQNLQNEDGRYTEEDNRMVLVFVELNHILEKIHINLHDSFDYNKDSGDLIDTEERTNSLVARYKFELDEIRLKISLNHPRLPSYLFSVEAYLHQFTLKRYLSKNTNFQTVPLHIRKSFVSCHECCVRSLEDFLELDPKHVATIPFFHMSRIIYTVGVLLLKIRLLTISVPAFFEFRSLTRSSVQIVNKISDLLEQTSKIYEHNVAVLKFQYVITLYVQAYGNKFHHMMAIVDNTSVVKSPISTTENPNSIPNNGTINHNANVPPNGIANGNATTTNVLPENLNGQYFDKEKRLSVSMSSQVPKSGNTLLTQDGSNSSTEEFEAVFDKYLTDYDSLITGFNALNDEFWTDIFYN